MSAQITRWEPSNRRPLLSVILSTYNQPQWLAHALLGYAQQSLDDFEIIVADDGSDAPTGYTIEQLAAATRMSLTRVWHPDDGFRKCTILNRAVEAARSDYLVFSDGDCIPRRDFLEVHWRLRRPGRFLSGGYCKLPMLTSQRVDPECIAAGEFARPAWLLANGCGAQAISRKLRVHGLWAHCSDLLSPTRASWNGHNASVARADLEAVNGFDERMQYGGEDREFGERLENNGLRGLRVRHRAVVVHLEHARGYVNDAAMVRNRAIRAETRRRRAVWTEHGISPGPAPRPYGLPIGLGG